MCQALSVQENKCAAAYLPAGPCKDLHAQANQIFAANCLCCVTPAVAPHALNAAMLLLLTTTTLQKLLHCCNSKGLQSQPSVSRHATHWSNSAPRCRAVDSGSACSSICWISYQPSRQGVLQNKRVICHSAHAQEAARHFGQHAASSKTCPLHPRSACRLLDR
jgi:hypothetical protein